MEDDGPALFVRVLDVASGEIRLLPPARACVFPVLDQIESFDQPDRWHDLEALEVVLPPGGGVRGRTSRTNWVLRELERLGDKPRGATVCVAGDSLGEPWRFVVVLDAPAR